VDKVGAKVVASRMRLSPALVYKWCQRPADEDCPDASGSRNPLDRVREIYEMTGEDALVGWLCRQAGGFLVKNGPYKEDVGTSALHLTQQMIKEFSEVLEAVSDSVADDDVSVDDARRIRKEWEELKCIAEGFVVACERGRLSEGPP